MGSRACAILWIPVFWVVGPVLNSVVVELPTSMSVATHELLSMDQGLELFHRVLADCQARLAPMFSGRAALAAGRAALAAAAACDELVLCQLLECGESPSVGGSHCGEMSARVTLRYLWHR